jgi:hypothetical protein
VLAQVRHRRDDDLGRQIRHDGHGRRLPQHRARAVGDGLRRILEAVLDAAAHREERAAGPRGAAVLREIVTDESRGSAASPRAACEARRRVALIAWPPGAQARWRRHGRIGRHGEQAQRAADDAGEHGRGHFAAVILAGAGLVDDHDGREARIAGRRDAAEHREIRSVA